MKREAGSKFGREPCVCFNGRCDRRFCPAGKDGRKAMIKDMRSFVEPDVDRRCEKDGRSYKIFEKDKG